MKKYRIGIDIGGTNTDAVLIDAEGKVLASAKTYTTEDVSHGFRQAIQMVLAQSKIRPSDVSGINVGTTHATNALLQNRGLLRVGVIRIAGHHPDSIPAAYGWPKKLKEAVLAGQETISGGFECHGDQQSPLILSEARNAIQKLINQGAESLAIVGLFSPLNGAQEKEVAELAYGLPVSVSHEIGGIGFIERENSTILNAALKEVMRQGFYSLEAAAHDCGITSSLNITQNDGSLISLDQAIAYPVLTLSSGPTNSFVGAARLAQQETALVVDIGGTSTDVGIVERGFPLRSLNTSNIGGVTLNFPMPNVLSVALGGGSVIDLSSGNTRIGPRSVAKDLQSAAQAFGGAHLTLTDVALHLGHL